MFASLSSPQARNILFVSRTSRCDFNAYHLLMECVWNTATHRMPRRREPGTSQCLDARGMSGTKEPVVFGFGPVLGLGIPCLWVPDEAHAGGCRVSNNRKGLGDPLWFVIDRVTDRWCETVERGRADPFRGPDLLIRPGRRSTPPLYAERGRGSPLLTGRPSRVAG